MHSFIPLHHSSTEIQESRNYEALKCMCGIEDAVLRKQMDQLEALLLSMRKIFVKEKIEGTQHLMSVLLLQAEETLERQIFLGRNSRALFLMLEKLHRDGIQLVKMGPNRTSTEQLQHRIGVKPCIADCLDGLALVYDMHQVEYRLKSSLLSFLSHAVLKPSPGDISTIQQVLVDQLNIPKEEVQHIVDIILAEEEIS